MPNLNGGHLFIRCLKQEGIKRVFTIVGDTVLPLVDAAADEGIEFIDTRHEGAAMHMADGYARITGGPAVALFTGGPGFFQRHLGLACHLHFGEPGDFRSRLCRIAGKRDDHLPGSGPNRNDRSSYQGFVAYS